jgi:selenide, water dikinase
VGRKGGARPGDLLLLTKPLGTGIITTAAKGGAADPAHLQAAIESMLLLNRRAAELLQQIEFHALTDVTGFACSVTPTKWPWRAGLPALCLGQLPFLPGAQEYAEEWLFPGGACNNQRTYQESIAFHGLEEEMQMLLLTPETSGGLLIALPPAEARAL